MIDSDDEKIKALTLSPAPLSPSHEMIKLLTSSSSTS